MAVLPLNSQYQIVCNMNIPVPGGPANKRALPAIFFDLIKSTTIPAASLAAFCPTNPPDSSSAITSPVAGFNPSPIQFHDHRMIRIQQV